MYGFEEFLYFVHFIIQSICKTEETKYINNVQNGTQNQPFSIFCSAKVMIGINAWQRLHTICFYYKKIKLIQLNNVFSLDPP